MIVVGQSAKSSASGMSQMNKAEIESLLKNGVYDLFSEKADQASVR